MITPRKLAVVATGVCGLLAAPALATTANDICAPSANPCLVQGTVLVSDGSILEFGTRALILQRPGSRLDIGSGSVTIRAGSLTMNPGSSILGAPACGSTPPFPTGGLLVAEVTGDIALLRDGNSRARIDVSNCANPGTIRLIAGGTISIEGILTAQGTQADGGFGTIDVVTPGDVTIPGSITTAGGGFSGGGEIFISSTQGEINVSGSLDSSGGDGGGVSLSAAGRILTSEGGILSRIDARATAGGGSGGIIDLLAGTDMTIGSVLHSQGEASLDLGGDGGEVLIASGGALTLAAPINLFGTVPDGLGGDADISSALDIVQLGAIDASGKRSFGAGGIVELLAQRNLTLGSINARGDCDDCAGGDVDAEGWCSVLVSPGAIVDAGGPAGTVIVEGGGSITVQGTVTAGSSIDVIYHPAGSPPNLSGALLISPTPAIVSDEKVVRCGGPGACDRDGVPEEGEECDEGTTSRATAARTPARSSSAATIVWTHPARSATTATRATATAAAATAHGRTPCAATPRSSAAKPAIPARPSRATPRTRAPRSAPPKDAATACRSATRSATSVRRTASPAPPAPSRVRTSPPPIAATTSSSRSSASSATTATTWIATAAMPSVRRSAAGTATPSVSRNATTATSRPVTAARPSAWKRSAATACRTAARSATRVS